MVMNADGSGQTALTPGFMADWQPLPFPSRRPVPGDYDGDGRTELAVFRPSTGVRHILNIMRNTSGFVAWGRSGDIPLPQASPAPS